jgi:polyisoprenoid-binding protein YceI
VDVLSDGEKLSSIKGAAMSATRQTASAPALPAGLHTVDQDRSEIGFAVKGMWGMVTVRGVFHEFSGTLNAGGDRAHGELTIDAASLDTGHEKRDRHLRAADFFDVEHHPRLLFSASSVSDEDGALTVTGVLVVGASQVELRIPAELERGDNAGDLVLRGECSVPREALGLGWNKLGAIRGEAKLHAVIVIKPETIRAR